MNNYYWFKSLSACFMLMEKGVTLSACWMVASILNKTEQRRGFPGVANEDLPHKQLISAGAQHHVQSIFCRLQKIFVLPWLYNDWFDSLRRYDACISPYHPWMGTLISLFRTEWIRACRMHDEYPRAFLICSHWNRFLRICGNELSLYYPQLSPSNLSQIWVCLSWWTS